MTLVMEEYIEQLLADWPPALRAVVQNILDEPIPEAVKRHLLKTDGPLIALQVNPGNIK